VFLKPAHGLKLFKNLSTPLLIFGLALLTILVLDQQPFGVEAVSDRVPRNSFLADRCSRSGRFPRILAIGVALSGRDDSGSTHFGIDLVQCAVRLVFVAVGWQVVGCAWVVSLRSWRFF